MHREDHGRIGRQCVEIVQDRLEAVFGVHVGRSVQRHEHVATAVQTQLPEGLGLAVLADATQDCDKRIDHDVADAMNALLGHALLLEVLVAVGRRCEQQVGNGVRDAPVDLLGHPLVEAAQAGLDVGHRDAEFLGRQATGHRRVDVAENDDQIRLLLEKHLLESDHDLGRLLGVRT